MTYNKPPGMRYVDMAIYFDENIGKPDRDDERLFQYLYHLFYMLSSKAKYFHLYEDYDEFALYAATTVYMRAIKPAPPGEDRPIKSILNYSKAVLYPLKVTFMREAFEERIDPEVDDRFDTHMLSDNLAASIETDYNVEMAKDFITYFKELPKHIQKVVSETPYKNDPVMSRRLYISILLTFMKSITLSNSDIKKVKRRDKRGQEIDNYKVKILEKEKDINATTWRIDPNLANYINLLTNKVRKSFGEDLADIRQSYVLDEDELKAIMMSVYNAPPSMSEEDI